MLKIVRIKEFRDSVVMTGRIPVNKLLETAGRLPFPARANPHLFQYLPAPSLFQR